ncbi:bifunctional 5,10-methylenetetrahydrofolate dehydrogenase/5,10-methenyltetrahydrofolate cyclohydrolase [Alkalibacillus silvisoli]|uniref:Bifunctional protein FolD n=1 Tax=Alkalibacillus silvisoli TaxID=392823 RepID=A0ABP3K1B8_9BACI
MTKLLYGNPVASEIQLRLLNYMKSINKQPKIATIIVGDDVSSHKYVNMKEMASVKMGIEPLSFRLDKHITQDELIELIDKLNSDYEVDGILLQHPIPGHLNEREAFDRILLEKDVDGVTSTSFGDIAMGKNSFLSCTPAAIIELIKYYDIEMKSKHIVVIGRSSILGKPLSSALINEDATVTTCHSYTRNVEEIVGQADIVIAAVGKPKFVKGKWIKEGAIVIDAGYNPGNAGDVDYGSCLEKCSAITPVPGGVGPVTIAKLLEHTVLAAGKKAKYI